MKRLFKRIGYLSVIFVVLTLIVGMTAEAKADEYNPIEVGVVTFLSGGGAGTTGIPARDTAEMLIKKFNAGEVPAPYDKPGFGGTQVKPIFVDEAGGNTKLVQEIRNLSEKRGVDVLMGFVSSGSCVAVAPLAEELEQMTLLSECGTPRIFEDNTYEYVFRPTAHGTMSAVGAAAYVAEHIENLESIAGINQNYSWGQDSWRDFKATLKILKPEVEIKAELFPKLFQGQYASEISKVLSEQPTVVFSSMWGGDLEALIVQAGARGLTKRSKLILSIAEIIMYRLQDEIPDGTIIGARAAYGVMARDTELNRWFRENYEALYDSKPTYPCYNMAQTVLCFKIAADKASEANGGKRPTMDEIRKAMEYLEFEAFGTHVKMALGNGHQAISESAYGEFHLDPDKGPVLTNIDYFDARCVNPATGMTSEEWLEKGMPGSEGCFE